MHSQKPGDFRDDFRGDFRGDFDFRGYLWGNWRGSFRSGTPEGLDELAAVLAELRRFQAGISGKSDHVECAGAGAFDIAGEEERFGKQGVVGNGRVRMGEPFRSERGRQLSRIPDFQAIRKEHDLNAGIAGVIAMGNGVDDSFGHGLNFREVNFVGPAVRGGQILEEEHFKKSAQ